MGTHSRIRIIRRNSNDILLWQHWDGYLEGVGDDLCQQIKKLLEKYSIQELLEMVENIEEGETEFETTMLVDLFTNKVNVQFDECDDIEFEYILDLQNEKLLVNWILNDYTLLKLKFDMIKNGTILTDIVENK